MIPERIVLVGLPGAGKSTVGKRARDLLVAAGRAWDYADMDVEIERRTGRSIPEIFARQGEAAFRKLERAVTQEWLERTNLIMAPGGGWVELGEPVEQFRSRSLFVYLQVSPEVAAARLGSSGAGRPLLAGGNSQEKLRELLGRRESLYLQSQHTLSADLLSIDEAASYIVALASGGNGD
jgi:shikimate kinase